MDTHPPTLLVHVDAKYAGLHAWVLMFLDVLHLEDWEKEGVCLDNTAAAAGADWSMQGG